MSHLSVKPMHRETNWHLPHYKWHISVFVFVVIRKQNGSIPREKPHQRYPKHAAGDRFSQKDGSGDAEQSRRGKWHTRSSRDHSRQNECIGEDRRDGCKKRGSLAQEVSPERPDQGREAAKDQIKGRRRQDQIGEQTSHEEAGNGRRRKIRKDTQRLRKAQLDATAREAERTRKKRQADIQSADHRALHRFVQVLFFHLFP